VARTPPTVLRRKHADRPARRPAAPAAGVTSLDRDENLFDRKFPRLLQVYERVAAPNGDAMLFETALALVIAVAGALLAIALAGFGTVRRRFVGGGDDPAGPGGPALAAPETSKQRNDAQPPARRERSREKARA
jgi:hypothetical protein